MECSGSLRKWKALQIKCFVCVPESANSFEVFGLQGGLKVSTHRPGGMRGLAGLLGAPGQGTPRVEQSSVNGDPEEWGCGSSAEPFLQEEISAAFRPLATRHLLFPGILPEVRLVQTKNKCFSGPLQPTLWGVTASKLRVLWLRVNSQLVEPR